VKDEFVIYALEKAAKKRPQIVSRVDILKTDRAKILGKLMSKRLREIERRMREKYAMGIDPTSLVSRVESFVETLGIEVSQAPEVTNYYNPSQWIEPDEFLKVWHYKDKRIAVEYIIGVHPPIGPSDRKTYDRPIRLQDIFNVGSLIEAGEASHGLFVLYWVGGYDTSKHTMWDQKRRFGSTIGQFNLDDVLFKIVGVIEEGEEDREDLVDHVNTLHLKLAKLLDRLIQREKPPGRRKKDDFPPIRYF